MTETETETETGRENETDTPRKSSVWGSVGRSAGVQVVVLGVGTIFGIFNTRLVVGHFGKVAFAQFGLLIAIESLLPFADLGMSAAIINAIGGSESPRTDPAVQATLVTSIRVLACSGAVIVSVAAVLSGFGLWNTVLGDGLIEHAGPIAAGVCLALIGLALPAGFGDRTLTGLGKNHLMIAIGGLQPPLVFACLLLVSRTRGQAAGGYLPIIPYLVKFFLALVAVTTAAKLISPQIGRALRSAPRIRTVKGGKVFHMAWPMLVQAIALPIAMQSDRIVLSHMSTASNLALYNLTAQMFTPIVRVIAVSSAALWPIFARARAKKDVGSQSPIPIAGGFAVAATAACLGISLISPWLARVASDGKITISAGMLIAFSSLVICQAIQYPLGTFLTDAAGLRYQALLIVLMVPFNLIISIVLAKYYGAVGPVIGSAVAALIFQALGNLVYAQVRITRSRAEAHSTA